jgi:hypothetical protein
MRCGIQLLYKCYFKIALYTAVIAPNQQGTNDCNCKTYHHETNY